MFSILCLVFENYILFSILFLFIFLIKNIKNSFKSSKLLPPGPVGLPFVGYLPFLGKEPHKSITKLGEKYGTVFTLQLGVHKVVVLNDLSAIKDAFIGDDFLDRPQTTHNSSLRKTNSLSDASGKVWREQRKFLHKSLKELGFGKQIMENMIIEEIGYIFKEIDESNGQSVNIHSKLVPSISNNIIQYIFGHRFEFNDTKRLLLNQSIETFSKRFSILGLLSLSPIWFTKALIKFGFFTKDSIYDKTNDRIITFSAIFRNEILIHKNTFNENIKRDYVDCFLIEMGRNPNSSFKDDQLIVNCKSLFNAGSETTRGTIEWLLLFAAYYSEHQKKIHEEIDLVIGRDRHPVWVDRVYMPYTQAFINETFRCKPGSPFNLLRSSVKDSSILGHPIPKNTRILANIWAVHNDPKLWQNPNDFNPNRFLTKDGKQLINTENLITFSIGKRNCPGELLARVQIFLYLTSLIQRYEISGKGSKELSFDESLGLALTPKHTVILSFKKRIEII